MIGVSGKEEGREEYIKCGNNITIGPGWIDGTRGLSVLRDKWTALGPPFHEQGKAEWFTGRVATYPFQLFGGLQPRMGR